MNLNPKTVGVFPDKPLVYFAVFNSIHCTNDFSMDCFNVLQLLVSLLLLDYSNGTSPNIIMILADDLGWNDVSFHGSDQIPTPNIDALAYSGVILNRHYAQPLCTPSRAALMTGKYPIHTGQQWALFSPQRDGLPLSEKILPQYLKELGYATHIVGKWHLGFYKKPFTPLARGFDSHFGYWTGAISYYNHTNEDIANCTSGHDLKRNYSEAWDVQGQYATQLFSNEAVRLIECHSLDYPLFLYLSHLAPHAGRNKQGEFLEAPQEDVDQFSYISDPHRRKYAAMVSILDKSVGEILKALSKRDMLQNSIVMFLSDNGSPCQGNYRNWGSNFPFRGEKKTVWDGGVRVPAVVWSPLISQSSRVSNDLMHISDWLPTLLAAAGYKLSIENIDGINQWSSISNGSPSPRSSLVVEIFERVNSLINGSFKYIKGTTRTYLPSMSHFLNMDIITSEDAPKYMQEDILQSKAWHAISNFTNYQNVESKFPILRREATVTCDHTNLTIDCDSKPCIFNIISDPCEQNDLSEHFPNLIEESERDLRDLKLNIYPRTEFLIDQNAFPDLHNGTWNIWLT